MILKQSIRLEKQNKIRRIKKSDKINTTLLLSFNNNAEELGLKSKFGF